MTLSHTKNLWTTKELISYRKEIEEVIGHRILLRGTKMLIAGPPKVGKSKLILQIATELANGLPCLRSIPTAHKYSVLVFALEDSEMNLADRIRPVASALEHVIGGANTSRFGGATFATFPVMPLTTVAGKKLASDCIERVKPDIVVYDPFYKVNIESENDAVAVQKTFNVMDDLSARYGLTTIVVAHTAKLSFDSFGRAIDKGFGSIRGSIAFQAWPDSIVLYYERNKTKYLDFMLRHGKSPGPVEVNEGADGLLTANFSKEFGTASNKADQRDIPSLLAAHGRLRTTEVADRLGISEPTATGLLQQLETEGVIQRIQGKDKRIVYWQRTIGELKITKGETKWPQYLKLKGRK